MTSAGVVLAETVCVKNSHLSPLGHTRHTRHAGHISTNPQVNALPIDLSGALPNRHQGGYRHESKQRRPPPPKSFVTPASSSGDLRGSPRADRLLRRSRHPRADLVWCADNSLYMSLTGVRADPPRRGRRQPAAADGQERTPEPSITAEVRPRPSAEAVAAMTAAHDP